MKYCILIVCFIALISCRDREGNYSAYKNRSQYTIHIGDTFMLVFDENSCCLNKQLNIGGLKSVKLIKDTILENFPKDCLGCSRYFGLIFRGINIGKDTLKFVNYSAGMEWEEIKKDTNKYERRFFPITVSK